MLNFIILGVVPGTHSQLTFYGLILAVAATVAMAVVILGIRSRVLRHRLKQYTFRLTSL